VIPAKIDDAGHLRRGDRLLRGAILDQLHTDQQPLAANIADDLVAHQTAQPVEKVSPGRRRAVASCSAP